MNGDARDVACPIVEAAKATRDQFGVSQPLRPVRQFPVDALNDRVVFGDRAVIIFHELELAQVGVGPLAAVDCDGVHVGPGPDGVVPRRAARQAAVASDAGPAADTLASDQPLRRMAVTLSSPVMPSVGKCARIVSAT